MLGEIFMRITRDANFNSDMDLLQDMAGKLHPN